MDVYSWLGLAIVAAALLLVGFAAAVEADLITISRARVRLLVGQGVPRAELLHRYTQERDALLRALALARNLAIVTATVLGAAILTQERGHNWGLVIATIVGALVVIGLLQALPRLIVARHPETWGLILAPFMGVFKIVFGVPARVLTLPILGRQPNGDGDDEMLRLMELEEDEGAIEEDERKMIRGVFGLEETAVREIMTPRTDIVAVPVEAPIADAIGLIVERGYSRIPVYEGDLDHVVGVVYAKDLIRYLAEGKAPADVHSVCRKALFVPESKRVDELLTEMRRQRTHMAIVIDEYGGTAGLVTIEDMLEEIVGEIEDEYDPAEERVVRVSDREAIVDGRVSIDELNELFSLDIEGEDFDTVGGCVLHVLGKMPMVGDEADVDGLKLSVLTLDGHRVGRVRATVQEKPLADEAAANGNGRANGNGNGKKPDNGG